MNHYLIGLVLMAFIVLIRYAVINVFKLAYYETKLKNSGIKNSVKGKGFFELMRSSK